jgi:hypothetical protein
MQDRVEYSTFRFQDPDARSLAALKKHRPTRGFNGYEKRINGVSHIVVDRHLRDFNQHLVSIGESSTREILVLNPEASQLDEAYQHLKGLIRGTLLVDSILRKVMRVTRSIFKHASQVDDFIQKRLSSRDKSIYLHEFILHKMGKCRHHALLNAYLMTRLVEDGVLNGTIIHHRQNIADRAHTWNIFIEHHSNRAYSVDSQGDRFCCFSDHPDKLDAFYGAGVKTTLYSRYLYLLPKQTSVMYGKIVPPIEAIEVQSSIQKNNLSAIKCYIEGQIFAVGKLLFFSGGIPLRLVCGSIKQVPHRVAAIYNCLVQYHHHQITEIDCRAKVKDLAKEAIEEPRVGRKGATTQFYNLVLQDNFRKEDETLTNTRVV